MSTWDDKPNDYEHAVRLVEAKDDEIARLRAALEAARPYVEYCAEGSEAAAAVLREIDALS